MTAWGLLAPKGWVLVSGTAGSLFALVAGANLSGTVTLGSILAAALVIVVAGAFTVRSNVQSYWRGLAEERAAKIAALEEEAKQRDRVVHGLRNELAAQTALLGVERAKTDLTGLLDQLSSQHSEAMTRIGEGIAQQKEILAMLAPLAALAIRLTVQDGSGQGADVGFVR